MDKKELGIILSTLKEPQKPRVDLEQYTIPSELAAEILNLAFLQGNIKNKIVFDFGCGAGRLGIGAALLGAKLSVGVEIDMEALRIAKENLKKINSALKKSLKVLFVCSNLLNFYGKCDTIIQNPPFGIKSRHADRVFLEKALECGNIIYSLHRGGYKRTREFLKKFVEDKGGKIEQIVPFKFLLPAIFSFHKKPKVKYEVDLYVIRKAMD